MPYITKQQRGRLSYEGSKASDAGELNYLITRLVIDFLDRTSYSYGRINEVIGVLECAKLEFYRRIAAPYEQTKKEANGDVYGQR